MGELVSISTGSPPGSLCGCTAESLPLSPPRAPPHGPHTPLLATHAPPEFHWKKPLQSLRHKSFVGCHTHHPFAFSLQFATLTRSSSHSTRLFSLHRPWSRLWSLISVRVVPCPSSHSNCSKLNPRI